MDFLLLEESLLEEKKGSENVTNASPLPLPFLWRLLLSLLSGDTGEIL